MNKKIVTIALACGLFGKILGMESSKEKVGKQSQVDLNAAIIEAAKAAQFERVCELHEQGAAIDARDREGNTPLHFAAYRNSEPIARFLLDNNASIHAQGGKGRVPLHIAALVGAIHVGPLLLDQKDADIDCRDADGNTPLHMAASQNKTDFMQFLLERNASFDARDNSQKTVLHHAVQGGPAVIQFVLARGGAVLNTCDANGMSVLHSVVDNEPLVKLLVDGNADVNVLNVNQTSPLHRAAQQGSPETLRYLIGKGAVVNRQEGDGFTPLVFAVLAGKLENVTTLLDLGADATITDRFGLTALTKLQTITAIKIDNKKKIEKLLKKAIKNRRK
jgi:ankyrin repeat protein